MGQGIPQFKAIFASEQRHRYGYAHLTAFIVCPCRHYSIAGDGTECRR